MSHGIPDGVYELKIGESFLGGSSKSTQGGEYNTLRFDFKPASISSGNDTAFIATTNQSEEVQVIVPIGNQKPTIFRGSQKLIKGEKECLLIFDHRTRGLRLEKMHANINVKKTRDMELDNRIKEEIQNKRKQKMPSFTPKEAKKKRNLSTSSASMNEEDIDDNDDDDDVEDEEASALEQMMALQLKSQSNIKSEQQLPQHAERQIPPPKKSSSPVKKVHSPTKPHKGPQKSILHDDLQLSESSDDED